ncbi:MAG: hypothetical protein OFPI_09330 [Osedax symbiont Rs2]|nr:MAG: hypothetical protein OFPI_09330 [Osedax symbiont Rs2]
MHCAQATDTYSSITDQYIDLLKLDSNSCVALGVSEKLAELPAIGSQAVAEQRLQIEQFLLRLHNYNQQLKEMSLEQQPDIDQAIDLKLMQLAAGQLLRQLTLQVQGRYHWQQCPRAGEQISGGVFFLVTNDPRPTATRLDNILGRIEQIPGFLELALSQLETPIKRWVAIDIETIAGLPGFFASILDWAKTTAYQQSEVLARGIEKANKSLRQYSEALAKLQTSENFSIGGQACSDLIKGNGIELSMQQIHDITCEFVTKTQSQIASLQQLLIEKYQLDASTSVEQLQQWLAKKFAVQVPNGDLSSVIDRYSAEADKIASFIAQRQLFPIPEQQQMKIMQTPDFMAPMIPAGAMMQPAALREGMKTSLVYLTLSQALLTEHNELGIPVMMVHEGIPGHHLQLASASMHSSVLRKTFSAMEHAEGWTTMLEDYMLDQGYMGELTNEARFIAKLDISRIGARVAIDLYFMSGDKKYLNIGYPLSFDADDVFANAAKLLKAVTGFSDARVDAELNWYSQERGYPLCYLVGNHLVWQLKEDLINAQAGKLSVLAIDQLFHRVYLQSGNMPVAMLRQGFVQKGLIK